jgi:hypothetical protein
LPNADAAAIPAITTGNIIVSYLLTGLNVASGGEVRGGSSHGNLPPYTLIFSKNHKKNCSSVKSPMNNSFYGF